MKSVIENCIPLLLSTGVIIVIVLFLVRKVKNMARFLIIMGVVWLFSLGSSMTMNSKIDNVKAVSASVVSLTQHQTVKYMTLSSTKVFRDNKDKFEIPENISKSDTIKIVSLIEDNWKSRIKIALGLQKIARIDIVE